MKTNIRKRRKYLRFDEAFHRFVKFCEKHQRLPERSRGDAEKSLYDFIKKNIDRPEMKMLHAKFGKGV